MIVRYTRRAQRDLETILDFIDTRSPAGARNVWRQITAASDGLANVPMAGVATRWTDVRVKLASGYPYKIFYRVQAGGIDIIHIRHAARRPWRG